jgi:glycosyltransferase involved in cell wall biosynthesis
MSAPLMTSQPLVSVVMTVLDPHPRYFPEAVTSILAQSHENLELVIVEDPSSSSAAEMLRQFADPRIVHHCNSERTSHSRQRNLSVEMARGELIATMDADDISDPLRVEKQVQYLEQHSDVGVVGSQLSIINEAGRAIGSRSYPCTNAAIHQAFPRYNPIAQPSVMFRKSVVREAGGYQYDRFPAVEDYELWSRLAARGVQFGNHPDPLVAYRLHPGGMKATRLKGMLRGTIDVKQRYWREALGWSGRLRLELERALLLVPPAITYKLFMWTMLRRTAV